MVVTAVGAACAPVGDPADRPPVAAVPPEVALEFLDVVVLPASGSGADAPASFGGVSALARDPRSGRYLSVIDAQPSRVAWLDIGIDRDSRLSVVPGQVQVTRPGPGVDSRLVTGADLEGLVALPDGSFVASEEGHRSAGERGEPAGEWPAALLSLSPELVVTQVTPWPTMFALGIEAGGVRNNQGAEALTITPDGRLIAGLERPLHRDLAAPIGNGRPASGGLGGPGRLVEFTRNRNRWQAARQWLYKIEATPDRPGFDQLCRDGELGLTDLLALDDSHLIALERACLRSTATGVARNVVLLHQVDLTDADDISGVTTPLDPAHLRTVGKRLILDLDTLIPKLPSSLANLENFEGLAFGPDLPDGRRTLLVISDDNFRASQKTAVMMFRIAGSR